jgi:hypothetical protein
MPLVDCILIEKKNRRRKVASPETKKVNKRKMASPESRKGHTKTPHPEEWKSRDTCDSSNTSYTDSDSMIPVDKSNNNLLQVSLPAANPLSPTEEKSEKSQEMTQNVISATEQTPPHDKVTSSDFDDNNQQKVPCFHLT